ncbi:MFS transporter [Nocardia stercoris]|uniref:MFS transporter n=1 Tax=Nocardia stercoris TaxID=2483361 RepID=A0A3M2LBR0_9NOCA|nr:MFS transporter [Nocardia stercoris]RMI33385.1 MFS transporter [Nocardia stercoris]
MTSSGTATGAGQTRVWGPAIFVVGGLQLLVVLDGTVVALALPRIREAVGLTEAGGNWIITAYVLAFGGLMLPGGRLGDTLGRKRVFVAGVAVFTLSSLLCGLSWNEASLITGRALQGIAAAVASPTAMALIAATYAPGKPRSQAFGIYAALTGIGSVLGLTVGGLLADVSWRLVFLVNVPIGTLVVLGALVYLHESQGHRVSLDGPGALLVTGGVTAAVFAVNEGPAGWGRLVVVVPALLAVVLLVLFVRVERRAVAPILPFSLFRNHSRVSALCSILVMGAIMMSLSVYLAMYLQGILRYSPTQSGLASVPFAVGLAAAAALASNLALRVAPRWLVAAGAVIICAGCLFAAAITTHHPAYFPGIAGSVFVCGFGFGLAFIALTLSVIAGVAVTEIGPITALAQVAQNLGGAAGLVAVGAVVGSHKAALGGPEKIRAGLSDSELYPFAAGYSWAFAGCAVLAAATAVLVLWMRFSPADVAEGQNAQQAASSDGVAVPVSDRPVSA